MRRVLWPLWRWLRYFIIGYVLVTEIVTGIEDSIAWPDRIEFLRPHIGALTNDALQWTLLCLLLVGFVMVDIGKARWIRVLRFIGLDANLSDKDLDKCALHTTKM